MIATLILTLLATAFCSVVITQYYYIQKMIKTSNHYKDVVARSISHAYSEGWHDGAEFGRQQERRICIEHDNTD